MGLDPSLKYLFNLGANRPAGILFLSVVKSASLSYCTRQENIWSFQGWMNPLLVALFCGSRLRNCLINMEKLIYSNYIESVKTILPKLNPI